MKILNFGSCNIDYVYSLDHIVLPGETERINKLEVFPGGKGLNQSIAVAKAGGKIYHAGCVGFDGEFLLEILNSESVDTSFIKKLEAEKNGHAIIQVSNDGENSIFISPGSNEAITTEHIDQVLSNFGCGDIILLQNEINNLEYIINKSFNLGMQIVLNPSPFNESISKIDLKMVSYLIVNEIEAKCISGKDGLDDILMYFKEQYPELKLVLTLGKRGAIYQDKQQKCYHPIFKTNVVDTTAAGDTFAGYFVAGVALGDTYDNIIKVASCASALAVSKKGAAPSIPYKSEVLEGLKCMEIDDLDHKSEMLRLKIEGYLNDNIADASLEELSKIIGYSVVYTGKTVERIIGKTFKQLLMEKRVRVAAKMLLETDMSITEIISSLGYDNHTFFRKSFRQIFGVNPLKYRKQNGKLS